MTDDIMRELTQIQHYAAGLQNLLSAAQAESPRSSKGADGTGTISAFLGPDGLPSSFRIEPGWNRKIPAENFGGAVIEACQAAMGERLSTWTRTLEDQGWHAQADRLRLDTDGPVSGSLPGKIPPAFQSPSSTTTSRSIDQVAEDMIKAFDDVTDLSPPPPQAAEATGASRSGKLALTLSRAGMVSCIANAEWVSTQTAATLMNALGEALTAARAELDATAGHAESSEDLDALLADAFALLSDPQRVVDS